MRREGQVWQGVGLGLAAGALWGGVFIAPRLLPGFSPLELTALRYLIYGAVSAVLVLPVWPQLRTRLTPGDWRMLFWLSGIGNIVYYVFLAASIQLAGVVPASLIVGLLPVTVTLIGQGRGGGAQAGKLPLALIIAGIAGVNVDLLAAATGPTHGALSKLAGVACAVGALGAWTAYAIGNARYLNQHDRFSNHEWSLLTGVATGPLAIVLALPAAMMSAGTATAGRDWPTCLVVMTTIAIGSSLIGNGLWNAASRILPPTLFGQMIVFETLFALLYGFLYEGRWPRPLELVAMALLAAGVTTSIRRHADQRVVTA